jgi:CRP-like cAMP-binding protein
MPDTRTIRQLVEERIAEIEATLGPLRAEQEHLRRALGRDGEPRPKPAGDGTRADQAVRLIGDRPGITAAQLAEAMGVSRNYLYRVLPKLQRSGVVGKRGAGYEVV